MYLKKVELSGFKSFADKTLLNFERGITGIIGPNGCGKSNISDAIRWCLGEQSAKSLRSSQMFDIIFAGTKTRAGTSMAEVSLTFDNSQNVLPVEYSEVVITRRLFRSGESEYYINKSQCRLKDIRDLFLDTGIGFGGYSIMEQGKIDFLITAKPEDRRELFEEAAGVAKYKARREETIKRLEKVEQDMKRLGDALSIHKESIHALDLAAKKAKQFQKFKDDLKQYEIADLVQQISFGDLEIEKLKIDFDPKIKEAESNNAFLANLSVEISDMRMELDNKNENYVNANMNLGEINTQIGVSDQIIQSSSQREEEIKAEQETLIAEISENETKELQYQEELKSFNDGDNTLPVEVENLEKEFRQKEQSLEILKNTILTNQNNEESLLSQIEDLSNQKDALINSKAQDSERQIHLTVEIASFERMLLSRQNEIEPTNNEIEALKNEINSAKEKLESHKSQKESFDNKISENEKRVDELREKLSSLKEDLASNETRIFTLKEFDQSDPIRSSIRAVLNLGIARGPVSSLISADADKEDLIASSFGDKLNYLICANISDAEKAVSFLEENSLPRLSFIVADKVNSRPASVLGLPSGATELIKILHFNSSDENIVKFICSDSIVSGNKVYNGAIVQGGGKNVFEKPVLIEEKIKKLQDNSEVLKNNIEVLQVEMDSAENEQIELRLEKENLNNEAVKLNYQIENRNSLIEEKNVDIKSSLDEIDKHKEEIEARKKQLEEINAQLADFDERLVVISNQEASLSQELQSVEDNLAQSAAQEDELNASLMSARSAWDIKSTQLSNKQRGQEYIQENITNIRQQIDNAKNRHSANENKLSELLTANELEVKKIQDLHEKRAEIESQIQAILNEKQAFQDSIDSKNDEYDNLRTINDELNNQVSAMQIDLKNFEFQRTNLYSRLKDDYEKNYEDIKEEFKSVEVDREEMNKLKRKIEALGAINMAAQEEYDQLEQRYAFLLAQQQDLLKAKGDLQEAIQKINSLTLENFQKTFDIVRGHFRNLYRTLFGGGEADLRLVDDNDLLESGIDIFAQPPGKKLQNISLYSGGEKALTAVALLFAFFMVKPSPFCILDEVDAPLDDANIGRYIAMIKDFSKDTQFLIATHNKRTMEMADILYGVTMEEKGISKIISVRMNREENSA
ncbi:MAG: chromosome segregation protein SMC [Elusimicrobiota bacterium]|jgi:chromosome segregation protein|nr:chromosome segregation protein SMC [Elusimicrobiota bacterium]